ncbi:MAG: endonuclease domain-containing protein [bacterium]
MEFFSYGENLKSLSRQLRRNSTDAEKLLWSKIRRRQIKDFQFYRQKPIDNYIADFYCKDARLVIEIDGGQHYENKNIEEDKKREESLNRLNLRILRFTNLDVLKNIENVVEKIYNEI